MPVYEIVNVLNGKHLLDSESYQRSYATRGGRVLFRGFYIVMWPGSVGAEYDESAEYVGPFKLALHAKMKLAQYLDECESRPGMPASGGIRSEGANRVSNDLQPNRTYFSDSACRGEAATPP